MMVVLEAGGLGRGGLNFDARVRRESTDVEDLFIAHIAVDAAGTRLGSGKMGRRMPGKPG